MSTSPGRRSATAPRPPPTTRRCASGSTGSHSEALHARRDELAAEAGAEAAGRARARPLPGRWPRHGGRSRRPPRARRALGAEPPFWARCARAEWRPESEAIGAAARHAEEAPRRRRQDSPAGGEVGHAARAEGAAIDQDSSRPHLRRGWRRCGATRPPTSPPSSASVRATLRGGRPGSRRRGDRGLAHGARRHRPRLGARAASRSRPGHGARTNGPSRRSTAPGVNSASSRCGQGSGRSRWGRSCEERAGLPEAGRGSAGGPGRWSTRSPRETARSRSACGLAASARADIPPSPTNVPAVDPRPAGSPASIALGATTIATPPARQRSSSWPPPRPRGERRRAAKPTRLLRRGPSRMAGALFGMDPRRPRPADAFAQAPGPCVAAPRCAGIHEGVPSAEHSRERGSAPHPRSLRTRILRRFVGPHRRAPSRGSWMPPRSRATAVPE